MKIYYKATYTYKLFKLFMTEIQDFISTVGEIVTYGIEFLKGLKNSSTSYKEVIEQCSRFGISSLPITLSIVGMTSIIISGIYHSIKSYRAPQPANLPLNLVFS